SSDVCSSDLKKRIILHILLYAMLFSILLLNSITIVEWLNRSLFVVYTIGPTEESHYYYYGEILLVFLVALFMYAVIATFIVSFLATHILFITLVIAYYITYDKRNKFITFSELKTIASPEELLSFINVGLGTAILIVISMLVVLVLLQLTVYKVSKKINIKFNK